MPNPVDDIPAEELAVELDAAREYLRELRSARVFAGETFADLDGFADGGLADAPTRHFREAQEHLGEATDLLESEAAVVASRIEAIEARIEEETDD